MEKQRAASMRYLAKWEIGVLESGLSCASVFPGCIFGEALPVFQLASVWDIWLMVITPTILLAVHCKLPFSPTSWRSFLQCPWTQPSPRSCAGYGLLRQRELILNKRTFFQRYLEKSRIVCQ